MSQKVVKTNDMSQDESKISSTVFCAAVDGSQLFGGENAAPSSGRPIF